MSPKIWSQKLIAIFLQIFQQTFFLVIFTLKMYEKNSLKRFFEKFEGKLQYLYFFILLANIGL